MTHDMVTTIQSVGVTRLAADQFSETEAVASSSSVEGRWACSSLAYSLHLAEAEDKAGDTGRLCVRVTNTMSRALTRDVDTGAYTVAGPGMTTQIGIMSPEINGEIAHTFAAARCCVIVCIFSELEQAVFSQYSSQLASISRRGGGLEVTFTSGAQHSLQQVPRPTPVTSHSVNWIKWDQ